MIKKYVAAALLGTALAGGAAFAQTTAPASPSATPAAAPAASTSNVQTNLKGNWRASKLVGLAVYNDSNEKLGDINEVLIDNGGKINAIIIGVGGFLGVGEHNIAVSFDKLKWVDEPVRTASTAPTPGGSTTTRPSTTTGAAGSGMTATATKDHWYPDHALMSGTKDQLKAMPAFKYSDYNQ